MSDINDVNNEYSTPPKNYDKQTFGNRPNEISSSQETTRIRFQVEEILKGVRTMMPGIVQSSFERDGAVWLKVQPGLSGQLRDGSEFVLPIVLAPLARLNIAGLEIDIPTPVQGDEVAIMCADRSISTFIKEAGRGVPASVSILSLNNSWVIPLSFSNVKRKRIGEETDLTITKDSTTVVINDDGVTVTRGDTEVVIDENGSITTNGETKVEINNSGVIINDGARLTARIDDPIQSTIVEDPAFWGWATRYNAFNAAWLSALTALQNSGGSPAGVVAYSAAMQTALGTLAVMPATLTGKITDGTDKLLLPD